MDRENIIEGLKKVWDAFNSMEHELYADYVFDALALLKEQEAVVRCKDCKAWKKYDDMNLGECELYPEYSKKGDWFCNFGERKEGR